MSSYGLVFLKLLWVASFIAAGLIFWMIVAVLWLEGTDRWPFALFPLLTALVLCVIWYFPIFTYYKVMIDGDVLRVSKSRQRAVIHRRQIQSFRFHGPLRSYAVDIRLREAMVFGGVISFMPRQAYVPLFKEHPIHQQLQDWLDGKV